MQGRPGKGKGTWKGEDIWYYNINKGRKLNVDEKFNN